MFLKNIVNKNLIIYKILIKVIISENEIFLKTFSVAENMHPLLMNEFGIILLILTISQKKKKTVYK